jgi:Zn-finger nucleic acid-binding protein
MADVFCVKIFKIQHINIIKVGDGMNKEEWLLCPDCNNKTRTKARKDTELKNFPLYCSKCKQTTIVDVRKLNITIIKEPDATAQSQKTQSR